MLEIRFRHNIFIIEPHTVIAFYIRIIFEQMLDWCKFCVKLTKISEVNVCTRQYLRGKGTHDLSEKFADSAVQFIKGCAEYEPLPWYFNTQKGPLASIAS